MDQHTFVIGQPPQFMGLYFVFFGLEIIHGPFPGRHSISRCYVVDGKAEMFRVELMPIKSEFRIHPRISSLELWRP